MKQELIIKIWAKLAQYLKCASIHNKDSSELTTNIDICVDEPIATPSVISCKTHVDKSVKHYIEDAW